MMFFTVNVHLNVNCLFKPAVVCLKKDFLSKNKTNNFRRKSSTRSLHQKLVVSKNNIRKATKLDMDDRAKMLQYFTR